jgi:hypothetical protein
MPGFVGLLGIHPLGCFVAWLIIQYIFIAGGTPALPAAPKKRRKANEKR